MSETERIAREIIHGEHPWLTHDNYRDVCARVREYEKIASQVVEGIWGEGWNLKNAITGAGYDLDTVLLLVEVDHGVRIVL